MSATERRYSAECEGGNTQSCEQLANAYLHGRDGIRLDVRKGLAIIDELCLSGRSSASTCDEMALAYREGSAPIPRDHRRAYRLFSSNCSRSVTSCAGAALLALNGGEVARDRDAALRFGTQACEALDRGDLSQVEVTNAELGCGLAGQAWILKGKVSTAIEWSRKGCGNNAVTCYMLARIYDGPLRRYIEADRWYARACELGSGEACDRRDAIASTVAELKAAQDEDDSLLFNPGPGFGAGSGAIDTKLAEYGDGCTAGDDASCLVIAAADVIRGDEAERKAGTQRVAALCTKGYQPACGLDQVLGCAAAPDEPVTECAERADLIWAASCDKGTAISCFALGTFFRILFRLPPVDESRSHLDRACKAGFTLACDELDAM